MENLKKTPLFDEHIKLNAKIVPFAGCQMPIQYTGIIDEHKAVRENVGIFDVSHMGEFFVEGEDSLALLQKIVPQDISKLSLSKAVYCQLTNKNGGIIDDLIIYKLDDEKYLLIVNASRIDEDFNWIVSNKDNLNVDIKNASDDYAMIALQGKYSAKIIEETGLSEDNQPKRFSIKETRIDSIDVFVARTGYTGEDGFEIIASTDNIVYLWNKFLEIGSKYNIKPIGLGARDTLRLEAGMLLYGQDIDENTTPIEASLNWSVPKDKIEDYNGKNAISSQINNGTDKKLIGIKMIDRAIPRHDYEIYFNGKEVGKVTSGGVAPSLNANIAMGYVNNSLNFSTGDKINIKIRNKFYSAEIVRMPFLKYLR
ncbi:MAG: glycine cleavage system aminomethyltransferase GcvT [Candidatus Gastranaerophilales bacterium]|nr:glycine cleavage system aminomethyltransferase GcvT [Candidatus Gastranaerophilales bacterium]